MTIHRQLFVVCVAGAAAMLAACSGQPESPTAPSALNSAAPALTPGSSTTAAHTGSVTIASAPAPSQSVSNFEIKFMTDMIDHHHMAVMMAEMGLAKAIHPELRSLHPDGAEGGDRRDAGLASGVVRHHLRAGHEAR